MKPKIEKVNHTNIYKDHVCCVVDYYPAIDFLGQINYVSEEFAKDNKFYRSVGIWKIKKLK